MSRHKKIINCFLAVLFINAIIILNSLFSEEIQNTQTRTSRGMWVSVYSKDRPLNSKEGVLRLIDICRQSGCDHIYLQLYQSGNAYYDSRLADRSRYDELLELAGTDTIDFLLEEAGKNNIKIFAWMNILSLGKNNNASILKKFGGSVLTRDQYQVSSDSSQRHELDKYYLKEKQLFLEPGDPRVGTYIGAIIDEIISRYPLISGIHLDYVRYPAIVPFLPGSRFNKFGLSYGYGKHNLKRFKEKSGIDPLKEPLKEDGYLQWDDWKRNQLTHLIENLSGRIRKRSAGFIISCAVIPSAERAYSSCFQDWPLWLEEGLLDYVVLMNYTNDERLAKEIAQAALAYRGRGKVYIGLGIFLMKENPEKFLRQLKTIESLRPDGIVFFSFDDLTDKLIRLLK